MTPAQTGHQWMRPAIVFATTAVAVAGIWFWYVDWLRSRTGMWDVVVVTLDTTRADYLGCYGRQRANTPTIDRLSREGVLYQRCFTPVPLTLPAHSTLFTGLLPPRHGIHSNGVVLSDDVETLAEILTRNGYATAAAIGAFVLDRQFGLAQGFNTYDDDMSQGHEASRFHYPERTAESVTDAALAWWNENHAQPRFMWVHYFDPHSPYEPPGFDPSFTHLTGYDAEIAYVDSQLQRLLAAIEESDRDTLIVLTADHGEGLGEHGEQTHGLFAYNSTLHVPLVVRFPDGHDAGENVNRIVSLVDVMPSILEWLGLSVPENLDGRLLAVEYPAVAWAESRALFFENEHVTENYGWSPLRGVIVGDWKLIRAPRPELYLFESDLREESNLVEQKPEIFQQMNARLDELLDTLTPLHASTETSNKLNDAARRKLESLGYVGGGGVKVDPDEELADPKDMVEVFGQIQLAIAYAEADHFAEASQELVAVVDESGEGQVNRKAVRLLAGLVAEESTARELGIPCLQRLIARPNEPIEVATFESLAFALSEEERYEESIEPWRQVVELMPENAPALYQLAVAYEKTGDTAAAIESYQASLQILEKADEFSSWGENARRRFNALQRSNPATVSPPSDSQKDE